MTADVETSELVPDYGLLGQTGVGIHPKLSLAFVTQVVETLTPVLDRC